MTNGEWKTVALDAVATIERSAIQPEAISQGTAYLGLEHIESGGKILGAKPVDEGELASSKFKFTDRHVLYGKLRPYLAKIACPNFTGICSTDILPILPGPDLERRFLCYFLRQPSMVDYANSRAAGANLPRLSPSALAAFKIPLPPLAEQRRIAEVLDRAEALRAKRRAALAQLDTLTQSLFLDLFGDPVTNSKAWKRVEMTDAVIGKYGIKAGPFGSSLKKEDYAESGYRIYGQEQVIAGRFDIGDYYIGERKYQQLKSCAVTEGDLLVSLVGSFGKVLVVPAGIEPGIINPRLLKITPNQALVTPGFLASLLQHPTVQAEFQRVAHGGTMGILNAGLLKQLKVILPPIPLQREFARRVTAVEALKTAQRASLAELDALFATLQHRAFKGEL